ncbi:MAG TPA: branched-chain amino acid ABC transporter permease [Gaiellaceae bacterium]|nr:branched-chain amino acid ABC transporter permease [Gaiellaceae bacterium]
MQLWAFRILDGLTLGGLLFVVASGFTLALGVMKIVNIAHGALYLLASYIAWSLFQHYGFVVAIAGAAFAAAFAGLAIQQTVLRRMYLQPLPQILATMGVALIIAEFGVIGWGGYPRVMSEPSWLSGATALPQSVFYPTYRLFIVGVAVVVALFLWGLLSKTRLGGLVRACVDDEEMARGMGVNVPRVYAGVFVLSSFLAGLAGGIGAPFLGAYQGAQFDILLLALIVVVVGGLGSIAGAFVASMVVGILDSVGKSLFPSLAYFTLFAPMIIILVLRPTGLRGRA